MDDPELVLAIQDVPSSPGTPERPWDGSTAGQLSRTAVVVRTTRPPVNPKDGFA